MKNWQPPIAMWLKQDTDSKQIRKRRFTRKSVNKQK